MKDPRARPTSIAACPPFVKLKEKYRGLFKEKILQTGIGQDVVMTQKGKKFPFRTSAANVLYVYKLVCTINMFKP